jgi:hypothetical protein
MVPTCKDGLKHLIWNVFMQQARLCGDWAGHAAQPELEIG